MVSLIRVIFLGSLLIASPSVAKTIYVSNTASNGYAVGNNANSCTAESKSTPKLTITAGKTCMVGGDVLIVNQGTYSNEEIKNPPAGSDGAYTIIQGDPNGTRPILKPNSSAGQRGLYCDNGAACHHIELRHFEIDHGYNNVKLSGDSTIGYTHHNRFIDNYFHDSHAVNFLGESSPTGYQGGDHYIAYNEFSRSGVGFVAYGPGSNTIYNPMNRTILEYNKFHNLHNGIGIWNTDAATGPKLIENVIIRYNEFYDIGLVTTDTWQVSANKYSCIHISSPGRGHRIHNNICRDSGEDANFSGIQVNPTSSGNGGNFSDIKIWNNTVYNVKHASARGILFNSFLRAPSTITLSNNIVIPVTGIGVQNSAQVGVVTLQTNRTSGTASTLWTDPANDDFSLKAGSAAIDAGTNVGVAFCGSAPDQGAFETLVATSASINGNTLDLTICNASPPIRALGTFTPACTGVGCGTPTNDGMSVVGGGLVRITVGGITGGACAAGQTWTVSGSSVNTDSALVGNTWTQPLHTLTNFSVDSAACTGTGGDPPPVAQVAEYDFESNLNDTSGNGHHAIGSSNISYAASKDGLGVQLTTGVDSYVDTGLLSGHNPSTNHLVVAFGVRISTLGVRRIVAGVAIGTDQRFYIRRNNTNVWNLSVHDDTSAAATEFPVTTGDTHVCVKFDPGTDTATLYINGVAGTIANASVQTYPSFTFSSTFRYGLPSGFATSLSGNDIIDEALIYTSDVSCTDIYDAWNPVVATPSVVQATHQWQGVYLMPNGSVESRGVPDAQRTVIKGGAGAVMAQLNCSGGSCGTVQPRFRYNVNGGAFSNVVPDSPTSDGVSYWGDDASSFLNSGIADGPIAAAMTHTDGITLLKSAAVPTITMAEDTSYTLRGIFRINAQIGDVACFKIYDQGGQALATYTPSAGACLTVIDPRANAGP